MVDVSGKETSSRVAVAEGRLIMKPATLAALRDGRTSKGDPLVVARIAGIQAAKRTSELIPFCHPLRLADIDVEFELEDSIPGIRARSRAVVVERTGVEMEALTATTTALLTAYDMLKGMDRGMRIEGVRLLEKSGGRSGNWSAEPPSDNPAANAGGRSHG